MRQTNRTPRESPTRPLTVIAEDPGLRTGEGILTAQVQVPCETTGPGPRGYRVDVIDLDSSTNTLYQRLVLQPDRDTYEKIRDPSRLLNDPRFHAQNAYGVVMSTLTAFERALGRRLPWGFENGHQIKVAPHAFAEANAFYSREDEALLFGYFRGGLSGSWVYSCLSHDILAHETTHALVDGLRPRFMEPSSPDQEAFHEGFSDIVALLSIFRIPQVVEASLGPPRMRGRLVPISSLTSERLRRSSLLSLADQMGAEYNAVRGEPLRQSATLPPSRRILDRADRQEAHDRGEVFVAAVLRAFLDVWASRLKGLSSPGVRRLNRQRVAEEGADVADRLLTVVIRALDYTPPVDLTFPDYLSALLTADAETYPDDSRYHFRPTILKGFARYGIDPATHRSTSEPGLWDPPPVQPSLHRSRFESMQRDKQEMFRYVWENRTALELDPEAYTYVQSVRPCFRTGQDGFPLRETLTEYVQILDVRADDLAGLGLKRPKGMPPYYPVRLYGGGALLFDEFGRLKYHIGTGIRGRRQNGRIVSRWIEDREGLGGSQRLRIARLHRHRAGVYYAPRRESW